MNRVERAQVERGSQRVSPDERERVQRLRLEIHPDHVEPGEPVPLSRAALAAEQIEQTGPLPPPAPRPVDPVAVYGLREDRRLLWTRKEELHAASLEDARVAMGMPWASWNGCREAIPPAYSAWVGEQLLAQIGVAA